ncbi:MAG: hypothetical protein ABL984_09640 [Pyrinomonadaceae bacterium]
MKWLQYLPAHWQKNVAEYLTRPEAQYDQISAADFINDLQIRFEDDSNAFFSYAFYLADDEAKEVAVFTEHCGYHVFPFAIASLETLDKKGKILRSESFLID